MSECIYYKASGGKKKTTTYAMKKRRVDQSRGAAKISITSSVRATASVKWLLEEPPTTTASSRLTEAKSCNVRSGRRLTISAPVKRTSAHSTMSELAATKFGNSGL